MTSDIIGYAAGILTTIAFIPQMVKVYQSKSAKDISFRSFSLFTLGVIGWLVYGFVLNEKPIIICNAITLVIAISILIMHVKYNRRKSE